MDAENLLLSRLEKLERQNRFFRVSLLVLGVLVGGGLLMAAQDTKPGIVVGTKFVLEDEDGKVRGVFDMHNGGPRIVLANAKSENRLVLLVDNKGNPELVMAAEDTRRIVLGIDDKEQDLVFIDHDTSRVVLGTDKDGDGLLVFRDGREKPRAILTGFPQGGLELYDREGKKRLGVMNLNGEPMFQLLDKEGTMIWSQPESK